MSEQTAWEAFARADWEGARDGFAAALEQDPADPEAMDGLGQALWWLGDREMAIVHRRDAYAAYQRRGESERAGGLAAYLATEHRIDGNDAASAGWISRARRLLADAGSVPGRGWLEVEEAKRAASPEAAERHARDALELAHELADPDIECMALAQLGRVAVQLGRVEEGTGLLDEAMAVALGGESRDPLACGDACCTTLVVCDGLADLSRAADWCEAVVEFTERRRFTPVQSWCRGIYAAVLVRAGRWERAEAVLTEALRSEAAPRAGVGRTLPLTVLAELRLRQGRDEEAARLLDGLDGDRAALAALVELHLQHGDAAMARALLERSGGDRGDERQLLLAAKVALASDDAEAAAAAARSLRELAERRRRADLVAEAALLGGCAALAAGDPADAEEQLEDAVERFAELGFPLEEGRARLALARALAGRRSPLALQSARAARERFERLGASRDADQAAALLRELGVAGRATRRGERGELTVREREVLGLLAAGLSNGEIAERLVIAPKTAEHHVSHVLAKLGVRSRAEAAAEAVREGI